MELNKYIDHTNLSNTATIYDIEKLCNEAIKYKFASVCVSPYYVTLAHNLLKDTSVSVSTTVGFPTGMSTTSTKAFEAINAIESGADEIEMVINIAALKNKDYDYVLDEIEEIRDSIDGHELKVIIETCLLTEEEIIKMTEICNKAFVNFIKTSTGMSKYGAKLSDVSLINEHKSDLLEIKASGGIKTFSDANKFILAGATRIGTSSGVSIMNDQCDHDCCGED